MAKVNSRQSNKEPATLVAGSFDFNIDSTDSSAVN
jgi:hypothetical protein